MIRKYLWFVLLVVSISANGQIIDGYINNSQGNPVTMSIDRTYLGIHPEVLTAKTSDGNFSLTMHEKKECIASINYNGQAGALFFTPEDTLHLAFTADLMDLTMQLSGNAAAENLFLKKFNKKFNTDFSDSLMNAKILNTSVDAFEIDIFNNRKKQLAYFKSDSLFNGFPPAFRNYMADLINYRYWDLLLAYPIVRANSNTSKLNVDELPPTLLEGFEKVKVSNADALICDSYRSFLKYYVIYFTSKQNGFDKFTDTNISMERKNTLAQTVLTGTPYQYWLSKFLLEDFEKVQPSTVKRLYNSLVQTDKTPANIYASIVKEKCGAYMEKKDEVKKETTASSDDPSGNCRIVNDKGKPVKFSDFKGKVVYVDFWASWCGPCRGEMPHSKELHHKFTEKQLKSLVFLYISIDKDESAWKKAVNDIGMEGVQGWSAADWNDGAGGFFGVNSIPRYMLIDKSGKIVDENAKRPSDPEVYGDLLYLLK